MYKVIAFDLDGTLVDTLYDIANSMNAVLIDNNLSTHSYEEYKKFIGEGAYQLVQKATGKLDVDNYFLQYKEYALSKCVESVKEFDDVTSTLLKLKEEYKLAVITNKPIEQATKVIDKCFPNIFDFILGDDNKRNKKPNIDSMELLFSYFNVNNKEVLYIGDSHVDYEFALNCNTNVLILTYGYSKKEFIDSIDDSNKINKFKEILNKIK